MRSTTRNSWSVEPSWSDLVLGGRSRSIRASLGLRHHKPFMMQRVYTGTDGLSHVENIELNAQSVMEKVTGAGVSVSQPGNFSDYHVGPERRYIIDLTGGGKLQVAEGKVDLPAG